MIQLHRLVFGAFVVSVSACSVLPAEESEMVEESESAVVNPGTSTITTTTTFTATKTSTTSGSTSSTSQSKAPPASSSPKGTASIIYYYFDNSSGDTENNWMNLAQDLGNNLSKAFDGYDYKVLLSLDESDSFFTDFNQVAENDADVVADPTVNNFAYYIEYLTSKGYIIDIFVFSHGGTNRFQTIGEDGETHSVNVVKKIQDELGYPSMTYDAMSIRSVYHMNCFGSTNNDEWLALGAKVSTGSDEINFYPNQWGNFIDAWQDGDSFATAVADSNTSLSRGAAQTYILADATLTRSDWGGCPLFYTVLGSHECSKDYFEYQWDPWVSGATSGKTNMTLSSEQIVDGDGTVTINSNPKW